MAYQRRHRANLAEPTPPDRFVFGFDRVELMGCSLVRIVPFVMRTEDGESVRVEVEPALVFPEAQILDLISKLMGVIGKPIAFDNGKVAVVN